MIPQQDSAERAFDKLARTFAAQVETLKRYLGGGEQRCCAALRWLAAVNGRLCESLQFCGVRIVESESSDNWALDSPFRFI
jgi:hypothetical protein